jgi:hypothetical protein
MNIKAVIEGIVAYVEALGKEYRQIHYTIGCHWKRSPTPTSHTYRLSLRKCFDLTRPIQGLPLVIDEVRAVMGKKA